MFKTVFFATELNQRSEAVSSYVMGKITQGPNESLTLEKLLCTEQHPTVRQLEMFFICVNYLNDKCFI